MVTCRHWLTRGYYKQSASFTDLNGMTPANGVELNRFGARLAAPAGVAPKEPQALT